MMMIFWKLNNMNKKQKRYCVHVYPQFTEYPSIMASTPEKAEDEVRSSLQEEDIYSVEIKRWCECGLDNDTDNKTCEDCGKKL